MSDHDRQTLQEKMQSLRTNYLKTLDERKEKIEHLIALQEQNALGPEDRTELQSQAHKLSGTGATYGFPIISEAASALEDWLIDHPENSEASLNLTRKLLEVCRDILQTAPAPARTASASSRAPAPELPLLLIVDDDDSVRDVLTGLFRGDAHILTGVNTTEALAIMAERRPDLVLLDDMMPGGVSGLRMLEDRRSMPNIRDIPIVMITASKKPEEVARGLAAGAADYIVKPFDPEDVAAKIRARLKRMATRILIADSDEAVCEELSHTFHAAGLKTICAKNGDDAWAILQKQNIALAVLDRTLPGLDGAVLLRRMKEHNILAELPVIFLTARPYGADASLNGTSADTVVKPFDPREVVIRCLRRLKLLNTSGA